MNALNVIRKPVVTEKASLLEEQKVYAFWVNPKSTKVDVKRAFKSFITKFKSWFFKILNYIIIIFSWV